MRRDVRDEEVGDTIFSLATLQTTIFIVDKEMGQKQAQKSSNMSFSTSKMGYLSPMHPWHSERLGNIMITS
ncbi:hypothetical protein QJS10_CPA09g00611 [Acorus calamus]|uniref:Uncharacterized protein n=1 Tax=Acorus calamus TaxID=4465 RepID=A0AAV9EAV0_ACOCL|nr:hypothetical protein QJS10_CPA09g00611 [Acorus calamus]